MLIRVRLLLKCPTPIFLLHFMHVLRQLNSILRVVAPRLAWR